MEESFVIKSLGCKTNQIEGQIIKNKLLQAGLVEAKDFSADIFILNSCTVTSHSDSQCTYLINRAKRENPNIKVVLAGCIAQTLDRHSNFSLKNVDMVLGNSEKLEIEKFINTLFGNEKKLTTEDIFNEKEFKNVDIFDPYQTRVSIKIQDGCNNRCSYCIIPYARGISRSNSKENIISKINSLHQSGTREIVLTGIHIGLWGKEQGMELLDLLVEIEKTQIERVRLGSLYPDEINRDLIEFLKSSKKFCPHFHLSLQSLCDKTLNNMNRSYRADFAIKKMFELKENFNNAFFGCDIITGFPEESEEDFEITYQNLKNSPVTKIHAFPYSIREGTSAAKMKQVQNSIKTERNERLIRLSNIKHKSFLRENKNKKLEILYERKSKKTGEYSAITRNYIKVYIKSDRDDLRNTLEVVDMSKFSELY